MLPLKKLRKSSQQTTKQSEDSKSMTDASASLSPAAVAAAAVEEEENDDLGGSPTDSLLPFIAVTSSERPRWRAETPVQAKRGSALLSHVPVLSSVVRWMRGPSKPRRYHIDPFFPQWQSAPSALISRYLPAAWGNLLITLLICILWLIIFATVSTRSEIENIKAGSGATADEQSPVKLDCLARLWTNTTACGLDGRFCQPFDGTPFPFICPSGCSAAQVLEPYTVGDQEVNYRPLVIGGPGTSSDGSLALYRGDSFICPAAIHAGIITDKFGGCGIVTRRGTRHRFPSTDQHGILSIAFDSSFPLAFSLESIQGCADPQWILLGISVCATSLLSTIVTSPALFYWSHFGITFFQVALASDAPYFPDTASVISTAFERFLPAVFVGLAIYLYCIRHTLTNFEAYWERTVLWVGGCWVGALNVYTFDRIPISRLTPHDLRQQPGAIMALIIILVVIVAAAIGQAWAFRVEGRLLRYIGFYLLVAAGAGCLTIIPGLDLRIHHYIIGLALLPGTSLQTRPSLLYQGILLGLFINGVARWGFASILQTPAALRGGGQLGSPLPTGIVPEIISNTITFTFTQLAARYDGMSVLINDVERYQERNLRLPANFTWNRTNPDETLFFRFAFTGSYALGGVWYGDFTKPGIWFGNGTWKDMLPGPSK